MSQDTTVLETRLAEQEAFDPPEAFVEQANVRDERILDDAPELRNRRRDSGESPTVTGQSSSSR
ncbi:hypothetical protein [Halogranum rubrum]|uniref:hypothetical protein n=1 Tax=Halogranum rubrum TaxID=553466 RepID=UPI001160391D|nr:hypothetical protein [Halogranum rubrum]